MDDNFERPGTTRRRFIRNAGVASVAVSPQSEERLPCEHSPPAGRPMKALLLPPDHARW